MHLAMQEVSVQLARLPNGSSSSCAESSWKGRLFCCMLSSLIGDWGHIANLAVFWSGARMWLQSACAVTAWSSNYLLSIRRFVELIMEQMHYWTLTVSSGSVPHPLKHLKAYLRTSHPCYNQVKPLSNLDRGYNASAMRHGKFCLADPRAWPTPPLLWSTAQRWWEFWRLHKVRWSLMLSIEWST